MKSVLRVCVAVGNSVAGLCCLVEGDLGLVELRTCCHDGLGQLLRRAAVSLEQLLVGLLNLFDFVLT